MEIDSRPEHEREPAPPKPAERSDARDGDERRRRGNRHHALRRKSRGRRKERGDEPSSAQMREARASGRTPGLSTAAEPAAVPLGTDDEAGGTPPGAAALRREIERAEREEGLRGLGAEQAMSGRPSQEPQGAYGALVALGAAVVILVLLAILFF